MTTFVIVGGGLAGAKAEETLRAEGFTGEIVLFGDEFEVRYERPPLSKGYLLGQKPRESAYVHPAEWYAENSVDLRTGVSVAAIERPTHTVIVEPSAHGGASPPVSPPGGTQHYDKLLLATGAAPRRLDIPGEALDGVRTLRKLPDSDALRQEFTRGRRVVIVGSGWIGLETAAAASIAGCQVTVIEPQPTPLYYAIGPELGGVFTVLHEAHGVEFRFGETAAEFHGDAAGRVGSVLTSSGTVLPADVAIVAIGAGPNDGLARGAGLEISNGVVTDSALRTSDPDIYAAGDVACSFLPLLGTHVRVEHAERRPRRREVHARPGGRVQPRAVLLHRPVRARHGVLRPAQPRRLRPGRLPRRPLHPRVHRILARRRPPDRRHERQHLGRHRRHPIPDPLEPSARPIPPSRPRNPAR